MRVVVLGERAEGRELVPFWGKGLGVDAFHVTCCVFGTCGALQHLHMERAGVLCPG